MPELTDEPAAGGGGAVGAAARIMLLGRPGCHLCDDARHVVRQVAALTGATWSELSVDDDVVLADRYGEFVPVVLVDGVQHAVYRVDAGRLAAALQQAPTAGPAWLRGRRRRAAGAGHDGGGV